MTDKHRWTDTPRATISLCCGIVRAGWRPAAELHTLLCREIHGGRLGPTYYLDDSGLTMDADGAMRGRNVQRANQPTGLLTGRTGAKKPGKEDVA